MTRYRNASATRASFCSEDKPSGSSRRHELHRSSSSRKVFSSKPKQKQKSPFQKVDLNKVVALVGKQGEGNKKFSPSTSSVSVLPVFQSEKAGHTSLVFRGRKPELATMSIAHRCVHPSSTTRFPAGFSLSSRAPCGCEKWWSATQKADILCQLGHVDSVGGEIPEHLDKLVWKGVEVDVELAICAGNISMLGHTIACSRAGLDNLLSTSFLVYVSSVLLSCTICTTCNRSSSPS